MNESRQKYWLKHTLRGASIRTRSREALTHLLNKDPELAEEILNGLNPDELKLVTEAASELVAAARKAQLQQQTT